MPGHRNVKNDFSFLIFDYKPGSNRKLAFNAKPSFCFLCVWPLGSQKASIKLPCHISVLLSFVLELMFVTRHSLSFCCIFLNRLKEEVYNYNSYFWSTDLRGPVRDIWVWSSKEFMNRQSSKLCTSVLLFWSILVVFPALFFLIFWKLFICWFSCYAKALVETILNSYIKKALAWTMWAYNKDLLRKTGMKSIEE